MNRTLFPRLLAGLTALCGVSVLLEPWSLLRLGRGWELGVQSGHWGEGMLSSQAPYSWQQQK